MTCISHQISRVVPWDYAYFDQIFNVVKLPSCVEIHSVYSVLYLSIQIIMSVTLPSLGFSVNGNDKKKKVIMIELEVLTMKEVFFF